MSNLTDYIKYDLYPRLFDRIPEVFPRMGFKRTLGGWESPYKLDGSEPHNKRKDKCKISNKKPNRIFEQGGDSKDLITYYQEEKNLSFIEAVKQLSDFCGLTLPQTGDSKQWEEYKAKQDRLETIAKQMERDLRTHQTQGAEATLKYLKEERGYSDEFIEFGGLGYISEQTANELGNVFSYTNHDGTFHPYGVGKKYTLAIPYRNSGYLVGFVFRSILSEEQRTYTDRDGKKQTLPKYKVAFITKEAYKRYSLFGLTGLKLTGDREKDKDIIVVEGVLDALRASFVGVPNVVATNGTELSTEAIQEAKRRGVKRITVLFDTEQQKLSPEDEANRDSLSDEEIADKLNAKRRQNYSKVKRAVENIHKEGLASFVCYLNEDSSEKTDVDEYLKTHTGEELKQAIENPLSGARFLFWLLEQETAKKCNSNSTISLKNLHELKSETIKLCNSFFVSPSDRDDIFRDFAEFTGEAITKESIQEEADLLKMAQDKDRQKQETVSLFDEALKKAKDGKVDEALSFVADKLSDVKSISSEAEFEEAITFPTIEQLRERVENKPSGLHSGYFFEDEMGNKEELLLPSAALTYICAATSHGKSRMLENLAINLATDGNSGAILYITYEETIGDTQDELLNIFANVTLSDWNNLLTIAALRKGNLTYVKDKYNSNGQKNISDFKTKEQQFYRLLGTEKKLLIVSKEWNSSKLVEYIRFAAKRLSLKAVFIDYVQLLRAKGFKSSRKDELEAICRELMAVSKDIEKPVVLAAQLNRDALSPLDMEAQNIADASNIEHSANVVMLLWSSHQNARNGNSYYKDKKKTLTEEALQLEQRGYRLGVRGKLYAILAKNRGGRPKINAVFDYDMNTGRITTNPPEKNKNPQQSGLSFGQSDYSNSGLIEEDNEDPF